MSKVLLMLDTYGFRYEILNDRKVNVPLLYKNKYQFQFLKLLDTTDVLMLKANREHSIDSLVNDSIFISNRLNITTVIVMKNDEPIDMNKLIANRIPFISKTTIFLPFLGTVLTKVELPKALPKTLTINQQRLLIEILLSKDNNIVPQELVKVLDISIASVYRILRYFSELNWIISRQGHYVFLKSRLDIYYEAKMLFINPISDSIYVPRKLISILDQRGINTFKSGLDALSSYSMLADNKEIFGLFKDDLKFGLANYREQDFSTTDEILHVMKLIDVVNRHEVNSNYSYPDSVTLQLWKYNPIKGKENKLDPITLSIISKDDHDDPRIKQSIDDLADLITSTLRERDGIVK